MCDEGPKKQVELEKYLPERYLLRRILVELEKLNSVMQCPSVKEVPKTLEKIYERLGKIGGV